MKRLCSCGALVPKGERCQCQIAKQQERQRIADSNRPIARQRGYNVEWERKAKWFLSLPDNELCACGCGRIANVVDHKKAHKGNTVLFWDPTNWQPMNRACNSRKKRAGRRWVWTLGQRPECLVEVLERHA